MNFCSVKPRTPSKVDCLSLKDNAKWSSELECQHRTKEAFKASNLSIVVGQLHWSLKFGLWKKAWQTFRTAELQHRITTSANHQIVQVTPLPPNQFFKLLTFEYQVLHIHTRALTCTDFSIQDPRAEAAIAMSTSPAHPSQPTHVPQLSVSQPSFTASRQPSHQHQGNGLRLPTNRKTIYDRNLNRTRNAELSKAAFAYLFSEMVTYAQRRVTGIQDLERR